MSSTETNQATARQLIVATVLGSDFRRATFGGTRRGTTPCPWQRITIRPLELRGEIILQFTYFDARKSITKNYQTAEVAARLEEILDHDFANIHLTSATEEIDLRTSKKGKVFIGRRRLAAAEALPVCAHNRVKQMPLPEGKANRLLEVMGIVTSAGQVRPTMRAKYTQINEFLRQITYVLDEAEMRVLDRPLLILDCGCGSSYLTLAAHHYLNDILGLSAQILGVDVNEEVIRKSVARAEQLGAARLQFACERIGSVAAPADIVLALHACDTATDDAIVQAVRGAAQVLLSVPCCHHHLNEQLRAAGPAQLLRPILRHGILHQRTADLVTDALRALILRIMGYRTEVIEFISTEHTARNLMIRAIRGASVGEAAFVKEYLDLRNFWGVIPYLETALGEPFQQLLHAPVRE